MAAVTALVLLWVLAFLLISSTEGAMALIILTTAALLGFGTRLHPKAGILATVAVLTGVWLSAQAWAPVLTLALAVGLVVVLVSWLRPHPPHSPA